MKRERHCVEGAAGPRDGGQSGDVGTPALLQRGQTVVGRGEGQRSESHAEISDCHAIIRYRRGRYFVAGVNSGGATFLNDRAVRRPKPLRHGDNLGFGPFRYRFIDPDAWIRRRNRRLVRVLLIVTLAIAGAFAHFEGYDAILMKLAEQPEQNPLPPSIPAPSPGPEVAHAKAGGRLPSPISVATPIAALNVAAAPSPPPMLTHTTPSSMPTQTPAPAVGWLERINHYRELAGLGAIRNDDVLSGSVDAHAHYLMANFSDAIHNGNPLGDEAYREDQSRSGYSDAGAQAAPNSQIGWGCGSSTPQGQIDRWIGPIPSTRDAQSVREGSRVRRGRRRRMLGCGTPFSSPSGRSGAVREGSGVSARWRDGVTGLAWDRVSRSARGLPRL